VDARPAACGRAEPWRSHRRLIGMTRFLRAFLGVALIASLAGCAASGSAIGPSTPSSGCGTHVVVDESANGSRVCVTLGSELIVTLHVATGNSWSQPQVLGGALGPSAGIPTPNNVVGWSFKAVAVGTSQISSSRPNCPAASPATAGCHSLVAFRLQADVR
jgi:hypothetical protein